MFKFTLYNTLLISIIIQVICFIIEAFILLFYKTIPNLSIIRELLTLEIIVQFIEATFYIFWLFNFKNITNITPKRYIDWVITTPTMLVTLIVYLIYIKDNNKNQKLKLFDILYRNFNTIISVLILNWIMLLFGYLTEINKISFLLGNFLGFLPFIIYFYIIFTSYVSNNSSFNIFTYFFVFWSLYGIAAMLPYNIKNTSYNILDLFAKNFFGLFLSYLIISG